MFDLKKLRKINVCVHFSVATGLRVRSVTCCGLRIVICHSTRVTGMKLPALITLSRQAGTWFSYSREMEGWANWSLIIVYMYIELVYYPGSNHLVATWSGEKNTVILLLVVTGRAERWVVRSRVLRMLKGWKRWMEVLTVTRWICRQPMMTSTCSGINNNNNVNNLSFSITSSSFSSTGSVKSAVLIFTPRALRS